MAMNFNYILDIYGIRKRYPKDPDLVSLFIAPDDAFNLVYFVYAACTKRDYSAPDLICVDEDTYNGVKKFFADNFKVELGENLLNNEEEIRALICMVSDVVDKESQTIGDMLKLESD